MDRTDKRILKPVVQSLKEIAAKQGYDVYDTVSMVIAFVQSFTYVSDSASTGFDEYPRYPVETLLAREGDCEDTSILTATLLRDMGYGTALIFFDDH
jgi:predicted transglutaminase-like cysteine proteinase